MKLKIFRDHSSNYSNPVKFSSGDILSIGEVDSEYPGWVRVKTADGNEGWAPLDYIELEQDGLLGKATHKYSAFELDVNSGEVLVVIKELNGWYWCKNVNNRYGWVPAEIGELIQWVPN